MLTTRRTFAIRVIGTNFARMQEKLQREVRNARAIVIEQTPDTRFLALVNPFFSSSPFSPSPSTPPSFSLVVAGGCMLGEGVLEFVCVFFFLCC